MFARLTGMGAAMALALTTVPASAQLSGDQILQRLQQQNAAASRNGVASRSNSRGVSVSFGDAVATGEPRQVAARPAQASPRRAAARSAQPRRSQRPVVNAALPSEPPVVDADQQVNLQITFETNSAFIRPGQVGVLTALCDALTSAPQDWSFNIVGHADAAGNDSYNLRLSKARAREVRRYLSAECSVPAARLNVFGVGERRPLPGVPAISEQNRRVEIQYSSS